eukprot:1161841-Pelagomonas_calceolata.AAC.4
MKNAMLESYQRASNEGLTVSADTDSGWIAGSNGSLNEQSHGWKSLKEASLTTTCGWHNSAGQAANLGLAGARTPL